MRWRFSAVAEPIRLGWYGDDFTGATDTLACLAQAGWRAMPRTATTATMVNMTAGRGARMTDSVGYRESCALSAARGRGDVDAGLDFGGPYRPQSRTKRSNRRTP